MPARKNPNPSPPFSHIGIDFGSRLAGTTAVCALVSSRLVTWKSRVKEDADEFLMAKISELRPTSVWIDAPLSLPGVYRNPDLYQDYFYREADRQTQAMSPMFLGGLTARSMRLAALFPDIPFYEAYPGKLAEIWGWKKDGYKKETGAIPALIRDLKTTTGLSCGVPDNFHELDAVLAWCTGWRNAWGESLSWGNPMEGLIHV